MEELLEKLKNFTENHNLLEKDSHIGVAVSGGPDSIFMLHILNLLKSEFNLDLTVLHFNHKLREEAFEEEIFVKNTAENLNLRFISDRADVKAFQKREKLSPEEAARVKRMEFFSKVRKALNLDFIATGHTKDDLVETFILNLLRGSSLAGLTSLKPKNGYFIRPILCFEKSEIVNFLDARGIKYKIDKTNLTLIYTRNRIRHKLIPLLKEFNPNITETLFKEIEILSDDEKFLSDIAEMEFTKRVKISRTKAELKIYDIPYAAIRRRIISKTVKELTGMQYSISYINLKRLDNIKDNSKVHLRGIIKAKRINDTLIMEKWR